MLRHLFDRRVPHVLAIYAGASWGLIEFAQFAVVEFRLSPHWTRVVMTTLVLFLPSVSILAWFHGRPGRDDVPLVEKIGISANLAVAATVLILLFGGKDLGAATTSVSVEMDDGETLVRHVPKPEFRKRASLFPFDMGPGLGEDDAWVPYLAPIALELDLGADEFFQPVVPGLFAGRLTQLGFADLQGVPLSLKLEVSGEFSADIAATGTVDRAGDAYRVTFVLYRVSNGSQVSETVHEGPDFLALIDEMSLQLADALEIPYRVDIEDLPVRERLTGNGAALEAFGRGAAQLFDPLLDLAVVLEQFEAAAMLDPTFSLAQYQYALLLLQDNRPAEALAPIRAAVNNAYRLPERTRFRVQSDYFFLTQQADEAWAVIERWATLHPEDADALYNYSFVQEIRGDWEGKLETLNRLYELNPGDGTLLREIADAHGRLGDDERALDALARHVEQFPDDYSGYVEMARIRRRRGEHDTAREHLRQALIRQPTMPGLVTQLAALDLDLGNFDEARRGYEEALGLAGTPAEKADVLVGLKAYYRFRGQLDEAIRTSAAWLEEASLVYTPVEIAQDRFPDIDLYLDAGRDEDANLLFERLQARLEPPLADFLIPRYRIHIEVAAGDRGAALEAYDAAVDAMEANDFGALRSRLLGDLGRIDELGGDYDSAAEHFREAMAIDPGRNFHREAGRALRHAGRLDEAESELAEALRRRPAEPHAHLEMALVLEARGEAGRAREHLRRALGAWEPADDSFEPAREARAKLGSP